MKNYTGYVTHIGRLHTTCGLRTPVLNFSNSGPNQDRKFINVLI
jgi:hypothetical protein